MRRLPAVFLLALLVACATPVIRLSPAYPIGAERTYSLTADSETDADVAGQHDRHRETLRARSTIVVLSADAAQTTLRITLTPTERIRDGAKQAVPPGQTAEVVVDSAGALKEIKSVGGLPPEVSGARIEDIAPLLGAPLPAARVEVGERWHRTIPLPLAPAVPGLTPAPTFIDQTGRVEALRRVHDRDCAVIVLGTKKPVARDEASQGGQPVRLEGVEYSTAEIAFAFRDGYPARIDTRAEARLAVTSGSLGGTLTVTTHTVLDLVRARP